MQTYNGLNVPTTIKTNLIISAFQNDIEESKIEEYAEIMKAEMLSNNFPPITGYPSILTDEDIANSIYFINGDEVMEDSIGKLVWFVTDGHHRSLAAVEANLPYLETTLDYSTITNETDFLNFNN